MVRKQAEIPLPAKVILQYVIRGLIIVLAVSIDVRKYIEKK